MQTTWNSKYSVSVTYTTDLYLPLHVMSETGVQPLGVPVVAGTLPRIARCAQVSGNESFIGSTLFMGRHPASVLLVGVPLGPTREDVETVWAAMNGLHYIRVVTIAGGGR